MLSEPEHLQPAWQWLGSDVAHRGRYIGKLHFEIDNPIPGAEDSLNRNQYQRVWSPVSVVDSDVVTQLTTQTFAFESVGMESNTASGKLCINSTDQAPAFSRWLFCGSNNPIMKFIYGSEQSADEKQL